MTFFKVAPSLLKGALIRRKVWQGNALGFGPFGRLATFWWPKNQVRGEWQYTPNSHYTLTRDDIGANDWEIVQENTEG